MATLVIVGNGFDRYHGLPTGYKHYRNFLLSTYGQLANDLTGLRSTSRLGLLQLLSDNNQSFGKLDPVDFWLMDAEGWIS